jgi:histidinol-phosphate aminotransferase
MNAAPCYTPLVAGLPATVPFVGPETLERRRGAPFRVRLGANESAFGCSPKAAAAMRDAIERIAWYNDPEGFEVREAIARRHAVAVDEVLLGAGIDEMLGNVVRMLVTPGTPVVTSLGAYPTFNYHVAGFGGALEAVPYRDDAADLDALLDTVRRTGAPLVYLANPDNPMGTWWGADDLRAFVEALPQTTLLVLDEAYVEFAPPQATWPMEAADPRVIRARVGYAIAPRDTITAFGKVRNHFGVNRIAQAGALASLQDEAFVRGVVAEVARGRDAYHALAARLGLASVPSATNFVCIDTGSGAHARGLLARLHDEGVFVRMPGVAPLDRCIRVTVGTEEERRVFAEVFSALLG